MRFLLLLMMLAVFLPGMAVAALPSGLVRALNQLTGAQGFSAQFEQTIRFSDGTMQAYRGNMAVLQPGRFRWHYTKPYAQLYVSDGHVIWHYEPDLMQVQVLRRMQGVDPAVMRLLDGSLGLKDILLIKADGKHHRYHVRIGTETEAWLGLAGHSISYVESVDALGNHNRISLLDVQMHPPELAEFVFRIPDGVDVLPLK